MKDVIVSRCAEFSCATCDQNKWELHIAHQSDDKTVLVIRCSNPGCIDERRQELNAPEDALIIHQEFDITNQGYDPKDMHSSEDGMVN